MLCGGFAQVHGLEDATSRVLPADYPYWGYFNFGGDDERLFYNLHRTKLSGNKKKKRKKKFSRLGVSRGFLADLLFGAYSAPLFRQLQTCLGHACFMLRKSCGKITSC